MLIEWPHQEIVEDIDVIMGKEKYDKRMPRERLHLATTLLRVITSALELDEVNRPQRDDLLEAMLSEVVEADRHSPPLQAVRELLALAPQTSGEIKLRLATATGELKRQERNGYRSKTVRLELAGKHLVPPVGFRQARNKQRYWAELVAASLYRLLSTHPERVRAVAVSVGVLGVAPTEADRDTASAKQPSARAPDSPIKHDPCALRIIGGAANVTRGDKNYGKRITARVGDVVKIQMRYESVAETRALRDFIPHFSLPTKRSPEHEVLLTGTARGGHFAQAAITIQSSIAANLVYIPGSAKWRRRSIAGDANSEYGTVRIDDSVIGPAPPPLDNVLPDRRHRATINILVRVVSDEVQIRLKGSSDLTKSWRQDIAARAGAIVRLRMEIRNRGNRPLRSLFVYCNLPAEAPLVPGSVMLTKPDDTVDQLPDGIVRWIDPTGSRPPEDGLSIGDLPVGKSLAVDFDVRIGDELHIGTIVTLVGVVRPLNMNEFYNTLKVTVQR